MRLTCPNCDAQYEVPDEVMPEAGRDVQCSDCGQTWFQLHPKHMPPEEDTPPAPPETPGAVIAEPTPEDPPYHEPVPEVETSSDPEIAPKGISTTQPPRRELDPAVASILREEAETEQQARMRARSEPLESQPDLGLSDGGEPAPVSAGEEERRKLEARQRMARLRGKPEPVSDAAVNAAAISSRRDLLPDIDEINSTLRTESERAGAEGQAEIDGPTEKRRKSGFRRGLVLMILLFVILALIYIFAGQLSEAVPQLEGALTSYVNAVDQMRLWLDEKVQGLAQWLDTKASESAGS